jgi:hypothetical protein
MTSASNKPCSDDISLKKGPDCRNISMLWQNAYHILTKFFDILDSDNEAPLVETILKFRSVDLHVSKRVLLRQC